MVGMPDTAFFVVLQYLSETVVGSRLLHLTRDQLVDCAYELLDFRVVAVNLQRDAVLRTAIAMLMRFERRESSARERGWGRHWRQQDRALRGVAWLPRHVPMTHRIRQLVRAHQVLAASTEALLQEHPQLRAAAAELRALAEARYAEDVSSAEESDD
jgi:hypothetical protein